jgi:hypothetical protein
MLSWYCEFYSEFFRGVANKLEGENMTIDIGDECTQCRKDTSFGSGRFVNRIPSATDELKGYLCPDCQLVTCEVCNQDTIEYVLTVGGTIICDDCLLKEIKDDSYIRGDRVISISPQEEFNPYIPPQHWLTDYPEPPKYEEGSDRGATDEF